MNNFNMIITKATDGLLEWEEGCIEGKVIVIDAQYFKDQYKDAKYQLVVACGGFGCYLDKLGNAVFVHECTQDNPEHYRRERYQVLGIASDELIEKWKQVYGEFNEEAIRRIGTVS